MRAPGEVGVFVRIRPTTNFAQNLIQCLPDGQTVNIYDKKSTRNHPSSWSFRLQGVLQDVSQEEFYSRVCHQVVLGALNGYNGTVMCFGQTGAGKTYTMTGSTETYEQRGVIPRALQEVFREVEKRTERAFTMHLSYLEIYNETLVDLLSSLQGSPHLCPHSMTVMEEPGRGVFVKGLSLHPVHSEEEALHLLFEGEMNRIIGSHALNRNSSRSHCIFTVHIESRSRNLSDGKYISSKLNLVDLAGSERLGKTGSEGRMLKETVYINRSLSFLEQVILALADHRRDHIPFRQSKLTYALKDSLGGNCNTVLVANVFGEAAQIEETISTLRFASRMKRVQMQPAVNQHMDPAAQIKRLEKEVQMLREELSLCKALTNRADLSYEPLTEAQQAEIHCQVQQYLEGSRHEITVLNTRQAQTVFALFKLAVQEQEQKFKTQLCQTQNLMEKDQSANTAAAIKCEAKSSTEVKPARPGVPAEPQKTTPQSSSSKSRNKKTGQNKTRGGGSPVSRRSLESSLKSKLSPVQTSEREQESQEPDTENVDQQETCARLLTPKELAFEDFKLGQGSKINSIFKDNKALLLERLSLLRQLAEDINGVKSEIDSATASIQQHQEQRQSPELLPEESEAALVLQLKELKAQYQQKHRALCDMKAEVKYCQHLVDRCRIRLFSEFEQWYRKHFLLPEELDATTERSIRKEHEEEQLLTDSSSSDSFYSARIKTLRRRHSRVPASAQGQRNSSRCRRLPPILYAT
ncbi:uncharacterized protein V6R79_007450 [Siganus canaliculatus]